MRRTRLAELLDTLAVREGTHPTSIPGVELARKSCSGRCPVMYEPMIYIMGQGRKRGFLGGEILRYDPDNYLVLSVPVPLECEFDATPEEPILAVKIAVEPTMLLEMLVDLGEPDQDTGVPRGIYATPLTTELRDAVVRLLESLRSASDSRVLGRQIVREIVYRVLRGEQGGALRAIAARNDQFARIARVLQFIHADFSRPLSTAQLAKRAGMSVSAFHSNFRAVTATSPLQYVKSIRLHRARVLMIQAAHNASTAAAAVGYESASQFGREFKRLFGASPGEERDRWLRHSAPGDAIEAALAHRERSAERGAATAS